MALRWFITETLTGNVVGEALVRDPSLTTDFDRSPGSAEIELGHMKRVDGTLDLPRAMQVALWIEPAGAYCLAPVDMEEDAGYGGGMDRILGEWMIRGAAPSSDASRVPVSLGGLLEYTGDRLMERDYHESGYATWIISDLLSAALKDVQVTIRKPTLGPQLPVDWEAGKVTYAQAIRDVMDASGVELRVAVDIDLDRGTPYRVRREIVFGLPIYRSNTGRVIDAASNGISVTRPTSIDLWANSVNVYGAGHGRDQIAGNSFRGRPGKMPTVTRSFSHPDVQTKALADAMAGQHLVDQTGIGPLQVEVLRRNWTDKYPTIGDAHRVVVDPCLAFPWGIDGVYRITRVTYQPPDGRGSVKPDTVQLIMEAT